MSLDASNKDEIISIDLKVPGRYMRTSFLLSDMLTPNGLNNLKMEERF